MHMNYTYHTNYTHVYYLLSSGGKETAPYGHNTATVRMFRSSCSKLLRKLEEKEIAPLTHRKSRPRQVTSQMVVYMDTHVHAVGDGPLMDS